MRIEKPIFVLGVPHSGTSFLAKVISQDPDIAYLPEANFIWMWGNISKPNDVLTENDLTPRIRKHINNKLNSFLSEQGAKRICDKTPRNSLRISFIYSLFPDAKIIHVLRDGRSVVNSISNRSLKPSKQVLGLEIWRRLRKVPVWEMGAYLHRAKSALKGLMGKSLDYWGARPPGWDTWIGTYPSHMLVAKQWAETIRIAVQEGRKLPSENYLEVRYEELVASPHEQMARVTEFLQLENADNVIQYAVEKTDSSRADKWKTSLSPLSISEVQPIIEPVMKEMGYVW